MVLITIVTGAYKPTNITGGPHIIHMSLLWKSLFIPLKRETHFFDVQFARFRSVATRGSLMRLAMPRAEFGSGFSSVFPGIGGFTNGHAGQEPIEDGGTDCIYIYIRPKFQGISPKNMAWNMVVTYLQFRILRFPLRIPFLWMKYHLVI